MKDIEKTAILWLIASAWVLGITGAIHARVTYLDLRVVPSEPAPREAAAPAAREEENIQLAQSRRESTSSPSKDVPHDALPQSGPIMAAPDSISGSTTTVMPEPDIQISTKTRKK